MPIVTYEELEEALVQAVHQRDRQWVAMLSKYAVNVRTASLSMHYTRQFVREHTSAIWEAACEAVAQRQEADWVPIVINPAAAPKMAREVGKLK